VRRIGVVTVGRSDYGIYLPLLKRIAGDPEFELLLFVSGMHLSPHFDFTVRLIEADGFVITERIEMLISSDSGEGVAKSIGVGVMGFAQAFAANRPDLLVVLGDRFEMYAAAVAALPLTIPIAHLHGGELTEGLIDDPIRHSITKLSHLHFVSTEEYGQRVRQMGEEPWRVTVAGALSVDNAQTLDRMSLEELSGDLGVEIRKPFVLATYHPVTLEPDKLDQQVEALLSALHEVNMPVVFTQANADTGGARINARIENFVNDHPASHFITNLGMRRYLSAMSHAEVMVGNSSSGIIEAASFKLPVVNTGSRQRGRIRPRNVIDVGETRAEITGGIRQALDSGWRKSLDALTNPYGNGHAAEKIFERLKAVELNAQLLTKRFETIA
jgi:UDP-hydrolysing UDP-N-acetyl-D-glucosamine 2-epimerase